MKIQLITLILFLGFSMNAQERSSITLPFEKGELTFQYYEKDGVKVPDGTMEYKCKKYTEKGTTKDGKKDGQWTLEMRYGKMLARTVFNYKDGLLDGKTTFNTYSLKPSTKEENLKTTEEYNFHKGHLLGENKIIGTLDTLYCNFDENGYCIGTWKIIGKKQTKVAEFSGNEKGDIINEYEVDILGNKTKPLSPHFKFDAFLVFVRLDDKIKYLPIGWQETRAELPSLCDIQFGYRDQQKTIAESIQEEERKAYYRKKTQE